MTSKFGKQFVSTLLAEKVADLLAEERKNALVPYFGKYPRVLSEAVELEEDDIEDRVVECDCAEGCECDDGKVYWQESDDWYEADENDVILNDSGEYELKEGKKARKLVAGKRGKKVKINESGKLEVVKCESSPITALYLGESLFRSASGKRVINQLRESRKK